MAAFEAIATFKNSNSLHPSPSHIFTPFSAIVFSASIATAFTSITSHSFTNAANLRCASISTNFSPSSFPPCSTKHLIISAPRCCTSIPSSSPTSPTTTSSPLGSATIIAHTPGLAARIANVPDAALRVGTSSTSDSASSILILLRAALESGSAKASNTGSQNIMLHKLRRLNRCEPILAVHSGSAIGVNGRKVCERHERLKAGERVIPSGEGEERTHEPDPLRRSEGHARIRRDCNLCKGLRSQGGGFLGRGIGRLEGQDKKELGASLLDDRAACLLRGGEVQESLSDK
ncbi:hypothetical protein BC937DRAFT_92211 [Endogone sp. FLAS-F59071]|nr:hypothetical protein BC937DRAFT_92211 [Endogone sp. FLAS-F59071]|eukprot:RUS23122.1 hypothetical protein BC937DRAFT_92211 [Endogone sp. FLAS-F59071]